MTKIANGTSVLIDSQVPEFITSSGSNLNAFLKAYYSWLEDSQYTGANGGGVLYQTKNLLNYKDLDKTTDEFISYFVNDFLPYFPPEIVADERKLIKVARQFYATKGSLNSLIFLLRVLYGLDAQVFYPKENILKVSDGKWYIPKALRLILSTQNENFPITDLAMREGRGSVSNATCIIENAYHTIDPINGIQVVEIFVSNVNREFIPEENLIIEGTYSSNNNPFVFEEKIIAEISGLTINPKYQGLRYRGANTANGYAGDPVVFYGGLANTPLAQKAIAFVGNTSNGFISGVALNDGGFGYTTFPNTSVTVVGGGGSGANVVVQTINVSGNILVSNDSINFEKNTTLNSSFYVNFSNASLLIANTNGPGNTNTTINLKTQTFSASSVDNAYKGFLIEYVSGTGEGTAANITAYNGTTSIATITPYPGVGSNTIVPADGTTTVRMYYANVNTAIGQAFSFENVTVGSITSMNVIDGGGGYTDVPTLNIDSTYETDWSLDELAIYQEHPTPSNFANYAATRQHLRDLGQIQNVTVLFGGTGYDPEYDTIVVNSAYGEGATFSFETGAGGSIVSVDVLTSGNGYIPPISTTTQLSVANTLYIQNYLNNVSNAGVSPNPRGTGAQLVAYGLSEGANTDVSVAQIGQIYDFNIYSRGFDYISTPNVSLRVVDVGVRTNVQINGLIGAGNTTSSVNLNSLIFKPSEINNFYVGKTLQIVSGYGHDMTPNSAVINAYNGTSGLASLATTLAVAPTSLSNVVILNSNVDFTVLGMKEGDFVYQGTDPGNTTFSGFLDNFGSAFSYESNPSLYSNSTVRLYNWAGNPNTNKPLIFSNANLSFMIPATNGYNFYGNGLARANVQFLNGLIIFPGYYINTDGQASADQYLQANTKYHNFSYVVQIEKSLNEYKSALMNIIHPSGTEMLNDMVILDTKNNNTVLGQNLSTQLISSTGSISINAYSSNNQVVGTGTHFTSNANVGDLLIINYGLSNREQIKTITSIVDNTHIILESNTKFLGPGYLEIQNSSNTFNLPNTANIYGMIQVGDQIEFDLGVSETYFLANVINITPNGYSLTIDTPENELTSGNSNVSYYVYPQTTSAVYAIINNRD